MFNKLFFNCVSHVYICFWTGYIVRIQVVFSLFDFSKSVPGALANLCSQKVCWQVLTGKQWVSMNCSYRLLGFFFLSFTSCHYKPKSFYLTVNFNCTLPWLMIQGVWAPVIIWANPSTTLPSNPASLSEKHTLTRKTADSVSHILWKIKICNLWINAFFVYILFRNYTVQLYHDFKQVSIHINPFLSVHVTTWIKRPLCHIRLLGAHPHWTLVIKTTILRVTSQGQTDTISRAPTCPSYMFSSR